MQPHPGKSLPDALEQPLEPFDWEIRAASLSETPVPPISAVSAILA